MSRQRIAIIGASGSIGTQTLEVIEGRRGWFDVVALAVGRDGTTARALADRYPSARLIAGLDGAELSEAILGAEPDVVVAAATGLVGINATIDALDADRIVAIANKEAIVAGGELVIGAARRAAARAGTTLLERLRPVDSEHSAIWQCLAGEPKESVERIWLTASGGPFRTWDASRIARAQVADALQHPTWAMGGKITVDSASLVNKGLEVIEAHRLFELPIDQISVLVHPESLLHGAVAFVDGSIKGQIGSTDMRGPIGYALDYPRRNRGAAHGLDLGALNGLTFETPDAERFPGFAIALEAGANGGSAPAALIVADDVATARFLSGEIGFGDIPPLLSAAVERFGGAPEARDLTELNLFDREVRRFAQQWRSA
jgi:1-deoxy-D-xylulose-5-phosphate reductoisomerase